MTLHGGSGTDDEDFKSAVKASPLCTSVQRCGWPGVKGLRLRLPKRRKSLFRIKFCGKRSRP